MTEYYIVNTDTHYRPEGHEYMLREGKAAAFHDPWKHKIDDIKRGDVVFLYKSKVGIVAVGRASGRIEVKPVGKGRKFEADGEHSQKLLNFTKLESPVSAKIIRAISQGIAGADIVLRPTLVPLRKAAGQAIYRLILGKKAP